MSRENLLFAIIGILLGFIVGFMFASSMAQKTAMQQTAASSQTLPADHPPVTGQNAPDPQKMREEVAASLEKARNEPKNFDAQIKAALLFSKASNGLALRAATSPNIKNNLLRIASHLSIAEELMRFGVVSATTITQAVRGRSRCMMRSSPFVTAPAA